jgi:hypothetical protein
MLNLRKQLFLSLENILLISVTKDGARIGSWIYWILIGRNYN